MLAVGSEKESSVSGKIAVSAHGHVELSYANRNLRTRQHKGPKLRVAGTRSAGLLRGAGI